MIGEGKKAIASELALWLRRLGRVDFVIPLLREHLEPERLAALLRRVDDRSGHSGSRILFLIGDLQPTMIFGDDEEASPAKRALNDLARLLVADRGHLAIITSWWTDLAEVFAPTIPETPVWPIHPLSRADAVTLVRALCATDLTTETCELVAEALGFHAATLVHLGPTLVEQLDLQADPHDEVLRASWSLSAPMQAAVDKLMAVDFATYLEPILRRRGLLVALARHEHRGHPLQLLGGSALGPTKQALESLASLAFVLELTGLLRVLTGPNLVDLDEQEEESMAGVPNTLWIPVRVHPGLTFLARRRLSAAALFQTASAHVRGTARAALVLYDPVLPGETSNHLRETVGQHMRLATRLNARRALWCAVRYGLEFPLCPLYILVDRYARRSSAEYEYGLAQERRWASELCAPIFAQIRDRAALAWAEEEAGALLLALEWRADNGCQPEVIDDLRSLVSSLELRTADGAPRSIVLLVSACALLSMALGHRGRFLDGLEVIERGLATAARLDQANDERVADLRACLLGSRAQALGFLGRARSQIDDALEHAERAARDCPSHEQRAVVTAQGASMRLRFGDPEQLGMLASARGLPDDRTRANINRELGGSLIEAARETRNPAALDQAQRCLTDAMASFIELCDIGNAGLCGLGLAAIARIEKRWTDALLLYAWAQAQFHECGRVRDEIRTRCFVADLLMESVDGGDADADEAALAGVRKQLNRAVELGEDVQAPEAAWPLELLARLNRRLGFNRIAARQEARAREIQDFFTLG
ncbi:hypothetical protein DB30_03971 [Enhygromyxa salina]|uniref:Uncharacterized protein n=1 Tax=Enhygromyxa salina TaxID=215803 RepID=A0A0C1ZGP6_9BACT|nr:hypothetical protein [Enhygromyxa salina]KIG16809.1 hypothetical protein DB30_03971 [Enhygromyxa salina]